MKKKILLIIGVLALAACITVYFIWNKPHKNVRSASAVPVTAITLYQDFMNDTATAGNRYRNQVLAVTGTITAIMQNQQQQQVILLKTATSGGSVNCTMEEKTTSLTEGDIVTLKGICSGYMEGEAGMGLPGEVFLLRCYHVPAKSSL